MRALTLNLLISGLAGVTLVSCATGPQAGREQQWLYRGMLGSGTAQPTAVFLTYDYSAVAFSATCDQHTQELVLRSEQESGLDAQTFDPIEISSSTATVALRTRVVENYVEGRALVTGELAALLRSPGDLQVFVPTSEMREPLYVGYAAPLRRLGRECRR